MLNRLRIWWLEKQIIWVSHDIKIIGREINEMMVDESDYICKRIDLEARLNAARNG